MRLLHISKDRAYTVALEHSFNQGFSMSLAVGTVVAVDMGPYRHVGIVSKLSITGEPLVISASARRGMVFEESLSEFLAGNALMVIKSRTALSPHEVVRRARSRLGVRWSLFTANCEHLVNYSLGSEVESPQVQAWVAVAALVASLGLLASR
jgi:hypothetical protein